MLNAIMAIGSRVLKDLGTLVAYESGLGRIAWRGRLQQDYYGKGLEFQADGLARLGKIPVGASRTWLSLEAEEVVRLATELHQLLESRSATPPRTTGIFETSGRFGGNIVFERTLSERGTRLLGRQVLRLLAFETPSGRGIVIRFDLAGLLGFSRVPIEMSEAEARAISATLNELVHSRLLEYQPGEKSIPLWEEVVRSAPRVLLAAVPAFMCPPFGLVPALSILGGRGGSGGRIIALLVLVGLAYFAVLAQATGMFDDYTVRVEYPPGAEEMRSSRAFAVVRSKKKELRVELDGQETAVPAESEVRLPLSLRPGLNPFVALVSVAGKRTEEKLHIYRLTSAELAAEKRAREVQACTGEDTENALRVLRVVGGEGSRFLLESHCSGNIQNVRVIVRCPGRNGGKPYDTVILSTNDQVAPGRRWYRAKRQLDEREARCPARVRVGW